MSRTVHHTPLKRWNQREHHESAVTGAWSYDWPVGNVIYDFRFFAGCRRTPQHLRHAIADGGYIHGHGSSSAVQTRAREIEGGFRSALRAFSAEVVKTSRSGADAWDLLEPDARTRHEAIWDAD